MKVITWAQVRAIPDAAAGLHYVTVGCNGWGRSRNAEQSMRLARSNGGKGVYTLHLVNKEAEVDDIDGMLRYNSKCPGVKVRFLQKYLH
jgi:hypothetical protein